MSGIGFTTLNNNFSGFGIVSNVLALIILLAGFYYLLSYFFGRQYCTSCNKLTVSEQGKSICSSCNAITSHPAKKRQNIYGSIILAVFGLLGIVSLLLNELSTVYQYFDWTGYLIMFCIGVYGIGTNVLSTQYCSKCGKKNTLIPLDTPKAQALIKEHNLTIPEEASQQSTNTKTSQ